MIGHGPREEPVFFPCDTCAHSPVVKELISPPDGRKWLIRQHLICKTPFVVYLLFCKIHNQYYTGYTKNLGFRWAQHKSDIKKRRKNKRRLTQHVLRLQHPADVDMPFLEIYSVEADEADRVVTKVRGRSLHVEYEETYHNLIKGVKRHGSCQSPVRRV